MTLRFAAAVLAAAILPAVSASALAVVTNTTQLDVAFAVSNVDLLQTNLKKTVAVGSFSREGEAGLAALTNGGFGPVGSINGGNSGLAAATADNSNTLTYVLKKASNLSSIATFAGWDAYRGGQSYTVSYATAAAPTTFLALASEYNNANGGGNVNTRAVITSTAGFLASNVRAIRFTFNSDLQYGYAGYREMDVIGTAVPEAGVWAMMIAGFGLVGFAARRRSTATIAA